MNMLHPSIERLRAQTWSGAAGRAIACSSPAIRPGATWLVTACCLLAACAAPKSRLLPEPLPPAAPPFDWVATAPDGVSIGLRQVIVRNSPGSWVRDADWDEYVLDVRNGSAQPLHIERFDLYSARLAGGAPGGCRPSAPCSSPVGGENPTAQPSTTSRSQLEQGTGDTLRLAKDAGIIVGSGLAPIGTAVALVGTSGGFLSASSAAAGAAVGAIFVVAPVAITIATIHVVKRHRLDKEDKARIDWRLADRGVNVPIVLAAEGRLEQSAFFPVTPAPTRIGMHYMLADEPRELWLPLPALAALHLQGAAFAGRSDSSQSGAAP